MSITPSWCFPLVHIWSPLYFRIVWAFKLSVTALVYQNTGFWQALGVRKTEWEVEFWLCTLALLSENRKYVWFVWSPSLLLIFITCIDQLDWRELWCGWNPGEELLGADSQYQFHSHSLWRGCLELSHRKATISEPPCTKSLPPLSFLDLGDSFHNCRKYSHFVSQLIVQN